MSRPAAVAGRFYPADPRELARAIDAYCETAALGGDETRTLARGCVVPHAGYRYSGGVAGAVYKSIEIPARCILLGPRHFPQGKPMAILTEGAFETPLGRAQLDSTLARELARACPLLREDVVAHQREHSLEVQIPFLQRLRPDFQFVPVVLATDRYGAIEELGRAVAQVVAAQKDRVLVIASTDMNHYESNAITRAKDEKAIARILALDPRGLYDAVRQENISMCGYAATAAMLVAMRELGATEAELIGYKTSAEAGGEDLTGERDQAVGYAGIVIQ
jgi:MEMO1 family protein